MCYYRKMQENIVRSCGYTGVVCSFQRIKFHKMCFQFPKQHTVLVAYKGHGSRHYRLWHNIQVSDEQFWLLLLRGNSMWYPFSCRPSGPQNYCQFSGKERSLFPFQESVCGCLSHSQFLTKPTVL